MQIDTGSIHSRWVQPGFQPGPDRAVPEADSGDSRWRPGKLPVSGLSVSGLRRQLESAAGVARQPPASIRALDRAQYAASLVERRTAFQEETTFSLELQTREGDVVSLQFRQSDFAVSSSTATAFASAAGFERQVSLAVTGELSSEELAAIDGMIAKVAEAGSSLFSGDLGEAASRLASIGFDSDTLASFALDFRQTTYAAVAETYDLRPAAPGLGELARRDDGVASLLDGLAALQRQLAEDARALFTPVDAARLGRTVVPAMLGFGQPESLAAA